VHEGDPQTGHYTAVARRITQSGPEGWLHCNDASVSKSNDAAALSMASKANVLIYVACNP
jgi:hypothetical protein